VSGAAVTAYKFLARGGLGPITRVPWPWSGQAPGPWLESSGPVALCRSGIHACTSDHLAYWLHEELWQIELAGGLTPGPDCVIAPRARLVRKIEAWSEGGGAQRFAAAVRDHAAAVTGVHPDEAAREFLSGYVADSSWHVVNGQPESPALAALCASMAVAKASELEFRRLPTDEATAAEILEQAYRRERAWQSRWIVAEMGLS